MFPNLKFSPILLLIFVMLACRQDVPPERKAIDLIKASHALGGELSVERTIDNWLTEKKDEVKPIGWNVTIKTDHTYLVSYAFQIYSWEKGSGEDYYYFLVNLENENVQNVTDKYNQQTKSLSAPFKDVAEISEQLIPKIIEEEKILSGNPLNTER